MTASKHTLPTNFPGGNSHRVLVIQPDLAPPEIDRLEDRTADAIGAARRALADLNELPYDVFKPLEGREKVLRDAVARRRMLTDEARHAMEDILRHLARVQPDDATGSLLDRLMRQLRDALESSHRVSDLIAAEKDVGWHRGFGR